MIATGPPVTVKGSQDGGGGRGGGGAVGHAWRGREGEDDAKDEREEDRDILLCHPPTHPMPLAGTDQ